MNQHLTPPPGVPIVSEPTAARICGLLARWGNALRDSDRDGLDRARRALKRFGVSIVREPLPYRSTTATSNDFSRPPLAGGAA